MEKRKIQNSVYVLETKPNPALPLGLALCFPKGDCVRNCSHRPGSEEESSRERCTEGSTALVGSGEPLLGAVVTLETGPSGWGVSGDEAGEEVGGAVHHTQSLCGSSECQSSRALLC